MRDNSEVFETGYIDERTERRAMKLRSHWRAVLRRLIGELRDGATKPRPLDLTTASWEDARIEGCRRYFHRIKGRVSASKYAQLVDHFQRANRNVLDRLPRLDQTFPLRPPMTRRDLDDPAFIKDMPVLDGFTPRTGGRRPSVDVAERDGLIRKCKRRSYTDLKICGALDAASMPVPAPWRKENPGAPAKWVYYYNHPHHERYRQRIHRLFSQVACKPKAC
jgi:hypothetical protein